MPTVASNLKMRVAALESQVTALTERLEQAEHLAAVRRGWEQAMRGEGIPAREAIEALRKKYNIPAK